jgi:isopenicillin N synthase-like dioxygenase
MIIFPASHRIVPILRKQFARLLKSSSAIAISLGAPSDFFQSRYVNPLARGQLSDPSRHQDPAEQRFGVAPHTDFWRAGPTCVIKAVRGAGEGMALWFEAPPIPGTLVCNIGDLLQRWSNDRFSPTVHRVG